MNDEWLCANIMNLLLRLASEENILFSAPKAYSGKVVESSCRIIEDVPMLPAGRED